VRVYLDLCAIQRPLDTPNHIRIVLEAEAILGILAFCDAGHIELVSSEALEYETEQSPLAIRKEHARAILAKARSSIVVDGSVEQRAEDLVTLGFKPLDALHLSLAEASGADYFCTCDDRLLRKSKQIQDFKFKVVSPIELVQEMAL
jgi:predicted nucleic acid-binding protein